MVDRIPLAGAVDRSEALLLTVAAAVLALAPIGAALLVGATPFAGAGAFVALILLLTGLHLVAGVAGLPSLGQAGFAALGALLTAEATLRLGLPAPAALLLGGAAVGLLAALAAPLCRLAAPAFAGATLALGALLALPAAQAPDRLALPEPGGALGYAVGATVALLALLAAARLTTGEVGAALHAAGHDPRTAAATGIDAARLRRSLFAIGAALAGLGGGALVQAAGAAAIALDPATSLLLLAAIALGGPGSLAGALLIGAPFCLLAALAIYGLEADLRLPLAGLAAAVALALRRHRTTHTAPVPEFGPEAEP